MASVTVSTVAGGWPSAGLKAPVMLINRGTDAVGCCADWANANGGKSAATMKANSTDTYRIPTLLGDVRSGTDYPGRTWWRGRQPMRTVPARQEPRYDP